MKRYRMEPFVNRGGQVDVKPMPALAGDWVCWGDYAGVQAEAKQAKAQLKELLGAIKHAESCDRCGNCEFWVRFQRLMAVGNSTAGGEG